MTTFSVVQEGLQHVPISLITPSATNPRKYIDPAQLDELAASIRSMGIKVPLSLRPDSGVGVVMFEIVSGERRWRAAQIAGLSSVPAIVHLDWSDEEARQIQLVENLQRADLSSIEEAQAYWQITQLAGGLPVEVLAAKVGKTVAYVTQRLRLLSLIPEAREALRGGALNLTLALLIARLQPADQQKATLYAVDPKRITKGNDLATRVADALGHVTEEDAWWRCATEKEMREWIADHTLLSLKGVAWRLDDVDLIPNAGPCSECPKHTGNSPALFGDLAAEGDTCTDPACYAKKQKAAVREIAARVDAVKLSSSESHMPLKEGAAVLKQGQWVEAVEGSCPDTKKGVTEGGQVKTVCANQKCKVHKHRVDKPLAPGESPRNWEEREKERKAKEAAYEAAETPIRKAVYAAIRPKLKGAKLLRLAIHSCRSNQPALAEMRGIVVKGDDYDAATNALELAIAKARDADLEGWLADAIASDAMAVRTYHFAERGDDREDLWKLGKLVGVDCDAIAARVEAPSAAPAKKSAKKAVRKIAAAGKCRYCGCTEDNACRLESGDPCWWLDKERTVCTRPDCLVRYHAERRRWEAGQKRPHLTSADVHALIRRKKKKGGRR